MKFALLGVVYSGALFIGAVVTLLVVLAGT